MSKHFTTTFMFSSHGWNRLAQIPPSETGWNPHQTFYKNQRQSVWCDILFCLHLENCFFIMFFGGIFYCDKSRDSGGNWILLFSWQTLSHLLNTFPLLHNSLLLGLEKETLICGVCQLTSPALDLLKERKTEGEREKLLEIQYVEWRSEINEKIQQWWEENFYLIALIFFFSRSHTF